MCLELQTMTICHSSPLDEMFVGSKFATEWI
jgi:hypothetical protein